MELIVKFRGEEIQGTLQPSTGSCDAGYQEMLPKAMRMDEDSRGDCTVVEMGTGLGPKPKCFYCSMVE